MMQPNRATPGSERESDMVRASKAIARAQRIHGQRCNGELTSRPIIRSTHDFDCVACGDVVTVTMMEVDS